MSLVRFHNKAIPIEKDGKTKYAPATSFNGGKYTMYSHQGHIVCYDTEEEALEYFE